MTFYFSVENDVHKGNGFEACINPKPKCDYHDMHKNMIKYLQENGAKDILFAVVLATEEEAKVAEDLGGTSTTEREFSNEEALWSWLSKEGWEIQDKNFLKCAPVQKFGHRKTANWIFAVIMKR